MQQQAARKIRFFPQDINTNDGGDNEGRKTKAGEGTPTVVYTKAASGAAMQAWKGNPKSGHEATSEANQVEESGKGVDSNADRGRGETPNGQEITPG